MSGEVVKVTVNATTLFNITITDDSATATTISVPNEIATVETSVIDATLDLVNVGTGGQIYGSKAGNIFSIRSLKDDDKTIEITLQNTDSELGFKLPDAGISTPDDFQINADSDSSANIKLVGASVDLSKAKLITDLDANSKDIDSVGTLTATNITTADLTVTDDLTLTDDLTIGGTAMVTGDFQIGSTMSVYGTAVFNADSNMASGKRFSTDKLTVGQTATIHSADITTVDINNGTIDGTTVGASTSSTGRFTTVGTTSLTAGTADLNGGTIDDMTIGATTPSTIVTTDLTATTVDINAGTIDGTVVGGTTPAAVSTTSLVATTADINAGTIDNSVIGATTPVAGTFTTATATTGDITTVNSTTVNATTVDINGGTIDGTTIGGSTSAVGTFSTMNSANAVITGGDISGADIDLSGQSITFQDDNISGDAIHGGTISNFASTGIDDNADQTVLTLGADEVAAFAGAVTIAGNLTVSGTETTVNTETINLADNSILLNSNHTGTPTQEAGIEVNRGTGDGTNRNVKWVWDETNDYWTASRYSTDSSSWIPGSLGGGMSVSVTGTVQGVNVIATGSGIFDNFLRSGDVEFTGGDITGIDTFSMASTGTFTAPTMTATSVINTPKIQPTSTPNDDDIELEALDFMIDARIVQTGTDSTVDNVALLKGVSANGFKLNDWTDNDRSGTADGLLVELGTTSEFRGIRVDGNTYLSGYEGDVTIGAHASNSSTALGRTAINKADVILKGGELHFDSGRGNDGQDTSTPDTATDFPKIGTINKNSVLNGLGNVLAVKAYNGMNVYTNRNHDDVDDGQNWTSSNDLMGNQGEINFYGDVDVQGTLNVLSASTISSVNISGGHITNTADIIPDGNKTRSLGSPTAMWKDVYVGPGSLYVDGHKVLGSDATGQIDISTDDDQSLNITAGASGTSGDITISSAGNTTSINDTTIYLGPSTGGATITARGTLEAPDLHNGALEFSGTLINQTDSNQNLEIRTNGSGYLHANVADLYVGPIDGAVKIDESSISVSNTNGDLNLVSNGTGAVTIDELTISQFSAGGENGNKIAADENRVLMLNASGNAGYVYSVAPSFWLGDGSSGAFFQSNSSAASTLKPWGQNMHIGPYVTGGPTFNVTFEGDLTGDVTGDLTGDVTGDVTGDLTGNLTANATTEQLTTKKIISNKDGLSIPGVPAWGGFSFLNGGGGIASTTTPNTGYPFVAIQQSASGQSQPQAAYFINNMEYDISGGLAGHGVQVSFAAQDETGKLLDIASNLCKLRGETVSGSAGSSTVDSWGGEYTLSVTGNAGSGANNVTTNVLTANTDFTEVSTELRVVDKPGNSGSTALSGIYLTYDGAQTGSPTGHISLRNDGTSTTTELMELEEDRVSHQVIQKQYKASSDPSGEAGDTYFNTTTNKFRGHNGTAWVDLG